MPETPKTIPLDAAISVLREHAEEAAAGKVQRLRQLSVLFVDVADADTLMASVGAETTMVTWCWAPKPGPSAPCSGASRA